MWRWCRVERRDSRYPAAFDTGARKEAEPDAGVVSGAVGANARVCAGVSGVSVVGGPVSFVQGHHRNSVVSGLITTSHPVWFGPVLLLRYPRGTQ